MTAERLRPRTKTAGPRAIPPSPRSLGRRRLATLGPLALALGLVLHTACARQAHVRSPPLAELREAGRSSRDGELVGRWLLSELVAPRGTRDGAARARARLDELKSHTTYASLARGVDDLVHGRLKSVSDHFLSAAEALRKSDEPHADLLAWYAIHHAEKYRHASPALFSRWQSFIEEAIDRPERIGWRARSALVEWWRDQEFEKASRDLSERAREKFGCIRGIRLAGPFGRHSPADAFESFEPERPGPWPLRFVPKKGVREAPRVLKAKETGCQTFGDEATGSGIFYAESFVDLESPGEVIIAIQNALVVLVDDYEVLNRDTRQWGIWPRFGVRLKLVSGRHRIVARLSEPRTSIRVLHVDGRPVQIKSDTFASRPISLVPPLVSGDANALDAFVRDSKVVGPKDPILRFIAAELAAVEGQGDIASVLLEPLVAEPKLATGPVLARQAAFVKLDPIFNSNQTRDLARTLLEQAAEKDAKLWDARLALALAVQEQKGAMDAVPSVRALSGEFPEVPAIWMALSRLYGELGWKPEQREAVEDLVRRFPDEAAVLHAAIALYDARGERERAEALVSRVLELDPDSELVFERALERRDYETALSELRRLALRRPERKDINERIHEVLVRTGSDADARKKLEAAIDRDPRDEKAWLALADQRFAEGLPHALGRTLVDAVQHGAPTRVLTDAIDLVEGASELEPYRLDPFPIIDAYEQVGRHLPGTAARVLDYSAVIVHADGSSRLLEHEIIRIQSTEGISTFAEHKRLPGLTLRMRVIKADRRVLEPEFVADKPTVTLPHLEIGDYIETEQIVAAAGDGERGMRYVGPRWLFREPNVAYARSEFVIVTPRHKGLVVETYNDVPPPNVSESGSMTVRRWRVDHSPAAIVEPNSPPATEFLPSIQVGWGLNLERRLRELSATVTEVTPVDPRVVRIAERIVSPLPKSAKHARAARLYRWVLDNVEQGEESDGRRVVVGKSGNRWRGFLALCRAIGVRAHYTVARSRLAPPAKGPMSEAAAFDQPLLRVETEQGYVWLALGNKYTPFGHLPAELRGVPAYPLEAEAAAPLTTPEGGLLDSVSYAGTAKLRADGSARLELTQRFFGRYAATLRAGLANLPEARIRDTIESRLVARALRGARLVRYSLLHQDDPAQPLVIKMTLEAATFANQSGADLIVASPFSPDLGQLVSLPARQTPLFLSEPTHLGVRLAIALPPGFRASRAPTAVTLTDHERNVVIRDRLEGGQVILDRVIDLPIGRISPADYPAFVDFARRAGDGLSGGVRVTRAPQSAR